MCHTTCLTCSAELFTNCLTCSTGLILTNGVCYCSTSWSLPCVNDNNFRAVIMFLDMVLTLCWMFLLLMYLLRVRLTFSYRMLSSLQYTSLLLYSQLIYLSYQDIVILKTLHKSLGPYYLEYRFLNVGFNHLIPTIVLVCVLVVLFASMYYPTKVFVNDYVSYWEYIKQNLIYYLHTLYLFGSKYMYLFIGYYIKSSTTQIISLLGVILFGVICLLSIGTCFYKYHNKTLDESIFPSQLYIYGMMAPATMVAIPLISSQSMLYLIFTIHLGVLLIVVVINRDQKIFTCFKSLFYLIQVLACGFTIGVIQLTDSFKTYIMVGVMIITSLIIGVEIIHVYYWGGIKDIKTKIHPEQSQKDLKGLDKQNTDKKQYGQKDKAKKQNYLVKQEITEQEIYPNNTKPPKNIHRNIQSHAYF